MNKITVDIDYDQAAELTRQVLINCLDTIEFFNNPEDVSLWDAMNEVIAYFSTPDQLQELELRPVRTEWMQTVLQHDDEQLQRIGY